MYSDDFRNLVKNQYKEYGSYRKVGQLCKISDSTVKRIVLDNYSINKRKPGPKPKLTEREMSRVKREIARISERGERVTSGKLKRECQLSSVSARILRNYLKAMNYAYKPAKNRIKLSKKHREERLRMANASPVL